jgi:uncharacterized protein (TIGR00369 family)
VIVPTKNEVIEFLAREFPQNTCTVDAVGENSATIHKPIDESDLRPGGTVSGPVLMTVADICIYVAILGTVGLIPLAVTTSFNINFLRRPSAVAPVTAHCRLIKVGRTLVVGEVSLHSAGDLVAHATGTYSIPPAGPAGSRASGSRAPGSRAPG